jgi:hypothetical protein
MKVGQAGRTFGLGRTRLGRVGELGSNRSKGQLEHPLNLPSRPLTAAGRFDSPSIQFRRNLAGGPVRLTDKVGCPSLDSQTWETSTLGHPKLIRHAHSSAQRVRFAPVIEA